MNNNELNNSAANQVNVHIGAIRHPENGNTIFEGMDINVQLTDKAYEAEINSAVNMGKFALPLLLENLKAFAEQMIVREDARRAERKALIEKENEELLKDWELHCKDFDEAKAKFEKEHAAWEQRKAEAKGKDFYEPEPSFYKERPARPHLHVCY